MVRRVTPVSWGCPIDLLTVNQHDRVLEAARAFIEGTYL